MAAWGSITLAATLAPSLSELILCRFQKVIASLIIEVQLASRRFAVETAHDLAFSPHGFSEKHGPRVADLTDPPPASRSSPVLKSVSPRST